jgi:hypothetical protein
MVTWTTSGGSTSGRKKEIVLVLRDQIVKDWQPGSVGETSFPGKVAEKALHNERRTGDKSRQLL